MYAVSICHYEISHGVFHWRFELRHPVNVAIVFMYAVSICHYEISHGVFHGGFSLHPPVKARIVIV